jgi:hypothetical protein
MSALRDAAIQLGGTIAIESHPGRGMTLRFRFPERELEAMVMRQPVATGKLARLRSMPVG